MNPYLELVSLPVGVGSLIQLGRRKGMKTGFVKNNCLNAAVKISYLDKEYYG